MTTTAITTTRTLDRAAPQNPMAERAVACAALLNPMMLDDIRLLVSPDMFMDPEAHAVFAAACTLFDGQKPIDRISIATEIRRQGMLDDQDVDTAVQDVADTIPSAAPGLYYAALVAEASTARALITTCNRIEQRAYEGDSPSALLDDLQRAAGQLAERGAVTSAKTAGQLVDAVYAEITGHGEDGIPGLSTGLPELDAVIGGARDKNMIVAGAYAKTGKTSLALNIAAHVAIRLHLPAAFLTFEMSAEELTERLLVSETGLALPIIRKGRLSAPMQDRVDRALGAIRESTLILDDQAPATISGLTTRLRRMKRINKIRFVAIDYFQLLQGDDPKAKRYDQLVQISRGLKGLAQELNIPMFVLAQLNQESQTTDRTPTVGDLADCKAIVRDANAVMILDRPAERHKGNASWLLNNAANLTQATIDVQLIRNGKPQTIPAHYFGDVCRWQTAEQAADARLDALYDAHAAGEYHGEAGQ